LSYKFKKYTNCMHWIYKLWLSNVRTKINKLTWWHGLPKDAEFQLNPEVGVPVGVDRAPQLLIVIRCPSSVWGRPQRSHLGSERCCWARMSVLQEEVCSVAEGDAKDLNLSNQSHLQSRIVYMFIINRNVNI
jgi:hypothetical protein